MNMTEKLEALKKLVMDKKTIDLADRIYIRNAISTLIREVQKEEEKREELIIPEFLTIKREAVE